MRSSPHPCTLRQLQYAVSVADLKSFRGAAERCLVSQPSLSAQIAELERALGVQLFERDRRRVLLTRAGEELVARARRILLEADDMAEAAKRLADPLGATLNVGVIPTVSPYLLPEVVPALSREHALLRIRWLEEKTSVILEKLESGEMDAGILATGPGVGAFASEVIGDDPFVLAAPPGHALARLKRPITLAELEGHAVLLLDDGHCFRDQALAVCASARASELTFRATSLSTLVQMVSAGAGVTLLPRLAAAAESARGTLAIRRFVAPEPHRTLVVIWRPQAALASAVRALAATCSSALAAAEKRLAAAVSARAGRVVA